MLRNPVIYKLINWIKILRMSLRKSFSKIQQKVYNPASVVWFSWTHVFMCDQLITPDKLECRHIVPVSDAIFKHFITLQSRNVPVLSYLLKNVLH